MKAFSKHLIRLLFVFGAFVLAFYFFEFQVTKAPFLRHSGDEASSALAIIGVADTGLPKMPSGLIYWRSPLAHYANGLSAKLLGKSAVGISGASLVSYLGLLLIFVMAFSRKRNFYPFAALTSLFLLAWNPTVQDFSYSPRMYMIYTFLGSATTLLFLMRRQSGWGISGYALLGLCILTALSHQHFIIFLPGLIAAGLAKSLLAAPSSIKAKVQIFLRSPEFWAPSIGAVTALSIHFGENYLPNVWVNASSYIIQLGIAADTSYVSSILSENMLYAAWLIIPALALAEGLLMGRWLRPADKDVDFKDVATKFFLGWIVLILSLVATSIALPVKTNYYVLPLIPLYVFNIVNTGVFLANIRNFPKRAIVPGIALAIIFSAESYRWVSFGIVNGYRTLVENDRSQLMEWEAVKDWVKRFDSTVISSDPDITFLKIAKIDYETRLWGLSPQNACSEIFSDQFSIPYVHSPCILEKAEKEHSGPVLFVGFPQRLDTSVGEEVKLYISGKFKDLGSLDGLKILCLPNGKPTSCKELDDTLNEVIRLSRLRR